MASAALSTKPLCSRPSSFVFPQPPNQRPQTVPIKNRKISHPFVGRAASSSSSSFPTVSSLEGYNKSMGERLADVCIVSAESKQPVAFKDLWDQNEGLAVVALLRHFGCPCCWELASALKEIKPRLDSAGVKLIAVGVGTPSKARILAGRLLFPLDCLYADPERKAYDVLGLYYGLGRTFFNPASAKVLSRLGSLQKAVQNYTIAATPDDRSSVLQQLRILDPTGSVGSTKVVFLIPASGLGPLSGGMFVFKGKQLLYARKDEGTGDHAPLDDVLAVCCSTTAVS